MKLGAAPRVILITDPRFGDEAIVRAVRAAAERVPVGKLGVQLRDKKRLRSSLRLFALRLRLVTRGLRAPLFINGDPTLARDVGADGVHLGSGAATVAAARAVLGAGAWVSVAAHTDEDVLSAVREGADAVLASPTFSTRPTSAGAREKVGRGVASVRSARVHGGRLLLVYALGGVTKETAGACALAGADGVAVIRAILASENPGRAARAIDDAFTRRW